MLIVGLILAISGIIGFFSALIMARFFLKKNNMSEDEVIDEEGELYQRLRKFWIAKIAFGLDIIAGGILMMIFR